MQTNTFERQTKVIIILICRHVIYFYSSINFVIKNDWLLNILTTTYKIIYPRRFACRQSSFSPLYLLLINVWFSKVFGFHWSGRTKILLHRTPRSVLVWCGQGLYKDGLTLIKHLEYLKHHEMTSIQIARQNHKIKLF